MNLCHCSKSSCSACSLPAGNVCECLSSKEKAVRSGKEKALQEVCEKALQEMTKRESDATKHLTALQRECADVKKRLADERAKTQAEREAKGAQDKAHRATIEGLEKRIESAEPSRAIQERMAELEKATHLAVNMEATSEGKRKASEKQLAAAREEVTELRERTRRAEETAAAANEERQQRAAEYVESTETERQLTSALAAARTEVDDLRAEMRKHASMRTALEESESIRDDLKAEVTRLGKQLAKEKEHTLAYEGAVAENRSLRERLDDAIAKAKHEAEVAATERGKAAALAAERVQLQASLTHAERVKELFASVTSRTNQVQDAANDVIASVAARRRAHAEQELHQAENGGAVTAAGVGSASSFRDMEGWRTNLDTNLFGALHVMQTFVQPMLDQENVCTIVNTGSKQGITCPPGNLAYNVGKAGIKVMTEGLQHELRSSEHAGRVSAHLFVPGWVNTMLARNYMRSVKGDDFDPEKDVPWSEDNPAAGAWMPEETIEYLFDAISNGRFYIICPDNDVSEETDRKRIAWAAADITERDVPLSRWCPDYKESFAEYMRGDAA